MNIKLNLNNFDKKEKATRSELRQIAAFKDITGETSDCDRTWTFSNKKLFIQDTTVKNCYCLFWDEFTAKNYLTCGMQFLVQ